ncbi:hypothetical protein DIRU0_C31472 [Diutina rugosa]
MNVTSQGYFTSQYLHTHPEWSHGPGSGDDERLPRRRYGGGGDGHRGYPADSARGYDAYPHGNVPLPVRTPSPVSHHVAFQHSPEMTSFNTANASPEPMIPASSSPQPHHHMSPSTGRPSSKHTGPSSPQILAQAPLSPQPRVFSRHRHQAAAAAQDPDALDEAVTPAELANQRWAATKKARRRQQSTTSNVFDPDYLEMGITPADLYHLNAEAQRHDRLDRGWGDRRRDRRGPHPLPTEYDQYHEYGDDRHRGFDSGDRVVSQPRGITSGVRVSSQGSHLDPTAPDYDAYGDDAAPSSKRTWSGYYINQKERYDAANDVKPYMYTHKTLREVFHNKQEPNSHYNPMEYVFDHKDPGKVKRAVDTVKHKLGKDNYKNYDYFEMRRAQIKQQDEAARLAAEEQRKQEERDFQDAMTRTPSPSAAAAALAMSVSGGGGNGGVDDEGAGAHEPGADPAAAVDAIYNTGHERKPNSFKNFVNKFKVAKWENTAWDQSGDDRHVKTTTDDIFDNPEPNQRSSTPQSSERPAHPQASSSSTLSHLATTSAAAAGELSRCSTPPGVSDQPSTSPTKASATVDPSEVSKARSAHAPSVIPRPDLESIATEYTCATTTANASPSSSLGDNSDADDPLDPLPEDGSCDLSGDPLTETTATPTPPVVVSTTPHRPSYKPQIMAKWPRGTSWGDDEPPAPKPRKPLFGKLKLKSNSNTKWGGGGGAAKAPSIRSAAPGSVRSVRTRGASTVITVDADGHSHVSRELVLNPHTNELEPPTSMSSMLHGEPPTAGPAVAGGGGGGGVYALVQTKLGPLLEKMPAVNNGIATARGAVGPVVTSVGPYVQQAHPTNFTNRLRSFELFQKAFRPLDDIAARYPILTLPIHILECFFFLWMMWEASKLLDILYRIVKIVLSPFHVLGQVVYKG